MHPKKNQKTELLKYGIWVMYLIFSMFALGNHELWGDEVHSWNIATKSESWIKMFINSGFEGHPPLWYMLLRTAGYLGGAEMMKLVQFLLATATAYLLVVRGNFKPHQSLIVLCGYFFVFEYLAICRNYALTVFLLLLLLQHYNKIKHFDAITLILAFLLSLSHVFGLLAAVALHLTCTFLSNEGQVSSWYRRLLSFAIYMPAVYFIMPPSSSNLNISFWQKIWTEEQYTVAAQFCLRSFFPMPETGLEHWWNTNYLISQLHDVPHLLALSWSLSILLMIVCVLILKTQTNMLVFYFVFMLFSLLFSLWFPALNARYTGMLYCGFIGACWVSSAAINSNRLAKVMLFLLLFLQLPAGIYALAQDAQQSFSAYNTYKQIDAKKFKNRLITDYWTLNYLSAATDTAYYTLGFDTLKTYIIWDRQMSSVMQRKDLFDAGLKKYFKKTKATVVYWISTMNYDELYGRDTLIATDFSFKELYRSDEQIERHSRLYLYAVKKTTSCTTCE